MHPLRTARRAVAGLALAGLLVAGAGCGSDDNGGGSANAGAAGGGDKSAEVTTVKYRGPFVFTGADAPLFYAQKLGYYEEEGLKVEISDSKGSGQTVTDVVNGGSDFGEAAATNLMLAVSQGQPVKAVATTIGKSSFGFIVPADSGIRSIRDLRGKSVAAIALVGPMMNAALAAQGLKPTDVKPVFADATAIIPTYMAGRVDALYTSAALLGVVSSRRPSTVLLQADAGYNPPDFALIVKDSMLEQKPELVAGFVRATLRGFLAAKRDPQAAVDALTAEHPEIDPAQALSTLRGAFAFYCSSTQSGRPYGENNAQDWSTAAKSLATFAGMRGSTDATRFFTNELFEDADGAAVGNC